MKKFRNIIKYGLLVVLFAVSVSCNEEEFLEETPLDFYSAENSYQTLSNFENAITDLYARVRQIHFGGDNVNHFAYLTATDIAKNARGGDERRFGDYVAKIVPTNSMIAYHWNNWYKIINNANTIITRLETSKNSLTEEEKAAVIAEAKFFRAFAYRYLVYLYGGVPLVLEEVTSPKTDFTRATKEEVLNQIVLDFTEAANNLPSIDQVLDGKVSNLVAQHFLAETLISLQRFDEAVAAASVVIEDPNTGLMTERFGAKAGEDPYDPYLQFTQPGDPFWDLFQQGNQNRNSGNREAIWVSQMEVDVPGGLLLSTSLNNNSLERWAAPVHFLTFLDPDGKEGELGLGASNYNTGGRGAAFMMNTDFFLNTLWESDWDNDIRNAPHNIVRDHKYRNPNSDYFMMSSVEHRSPTDLKQEWRWYPYPSKVTTPHDHPENLFVDKELGLLMSSAGSTFRDRYYLRLAETYLLRAEAYLEKGDMGNAAKDINMVRERSNANPVQGTDVTLDYILDERARELVYEEQRRITLHRTNKLVERVRLHNDLNSDEIQDYHELWPIPFSEIEANTDAVLEQNPGYN